MAQNLDRYRRQLYNIIKENTPKFTQSQFEANFVNKETFEEFVNQLEKNKKKKVKGKTWDKITFSSLATYYKMYACDMPWAKNLGYCGAPSTNDFDSFVGNYTTDSLVKKLRVYSSKDENDIDTLYLSSIYLNKIPQIKTFLGSKQILLLLSTLENGVFNVANSEGITIPNIVLTFTSSGFIITGKLGSTDIELLTAKKITSKDTEVESPIKDDKKKTDNVITTKTDDKKSDIPVVKSKPLYFNNDQKDTTPTKDCSDFPFTLGCVNTKIGDLNAKFFRGNRYGDMYNKQLEKFLDNRGYFSNSKNELTRSTWEYLMNVNIIKESVKKVLKEYINKK